MTANPELHNPESQEDALAQLSDDEVLELHSKLLHDLRDCIRNNDIAGIQNASVAISVVERRYPQLHIQSSLVTERDN